ncbi:oligopeptide transporter, OPT family [Sphingomonas ginkgonis]|uniref:Oligopeptide transporter, OPT family n=1 Tax=Sphingomonas ginkgonis TaxID=2315330 RepID=A0A3R9WPF2_9SPHN|nr:oligopeptide transporter, OPT family [Sphingomonas ginkgonis]RST30237.1 oligopeptide transporter, OPT family [Sphingomonas ginkgonis]
MATATADRATDASPIKELTLRGILLGAVLTLLFTAANVYLGLKLGITFATSIPAAVISMAVLKIFADSTIQENNIVQTIASAAGTLSAIIFVLPGLIMIGWWTHFPYFLSVAVIGLGGVLGVMYSVPLRRALVTGSDLPYPEGVAAAEVLKVGAGVGGAEENRRGLLAIIWASLVSAGFFILAKTKLLTDTAARTFRVGAGASGVATSLSMALIGVGHLVGMAVGIAMLVGILISWVGLIPWLTAQAGVPAGTDVEALVGTVFRTKVRYIGAGTMLVAALWTLLKVIGPVIGGIRQALAANRARSEGEQLELTERDLPITIVGGAILLSMVPIGLLLANFAAAGPLAAHATTLVLVSIAYVLIAGLIIASITGYMAGLIGASNSPVSGVGILTALGISLILLALFRGAPPEATNSLVAFGLLVTGVIFGVATIANDNLQDLKTGQLVGATPWRQQVALVIGVVFGALVIPPILDLLNSAFGFQGAPGAGPNALAAPQALLISGITKGVLGGTLDWKMIEIGLGIGVVVVIADELLKRGSAGRFALPPLAVGMGMYLPMEVDLLIPVGAFLGWSYDRWARTTANPAFAERLGTLMATGLIVGESLMGVVYAGLVAAAEKAGSKNSADVLALIDSNPFAMPIAIVVFAAAIAALYGLTRRSAASAPAIDPSSAAPPLESYR